MELFTITKKNQQQQEKTTIVAVDNKGNTTEQEEPIIELTKQEAKTNAKKLVGKKFVIGKTYMLRQKSVCRSREIVKKYVLKKFIYTSKNELLNVLILKQVDGPQGTIFTLNRNDCKRYHIKYEPGLQVFSMEFNWIPCKY